MPFWDFARSLGAAAGYPTKKEDVRVIPRMIALAIVAIAEWVIWILSLGQRKSSLTLMGIKFSMMNRTFCIDKAKKRLNYKPQVDMAEGIRRAGESFSKKTQWLGFAGGRFSFRHKLLSIYNLLFASAVPSLFWALLRIWNREAKVILCGLDRMRRHEVVNHFPQKRSPICQTTGCTDNAHIRTTK